MPIFDNRTLEDYKKSDPQGAQGFWLDLMVEIAMLASILALIGVIIMIVQIFFS